MAIPQKIIKFLKKAKVKYEPVKHKTVYTAYDKAATLRVPEKIVGKILVMKFDRKVGLVLIPTNKNLDKAKFKKVTRAKSVDFVKEAWMKKNLKGVKVGAFPPFGNLFKLSTFVDRGLMGQSEIIVNGGDYTWSIKITPTNFKKLVPDLIIGNFGKAK